MHFFCSNLLYYLQIDVVDSEFLQLQRDMKQARDFQAVLRAHRNFLANVLRASMVDLVGVQEGIERVLQVCLRFIAVCRVLHQQEGDADENDDDGEGRGHTPSSSSSFSFSFASPASLKPDQQGAAGLHRLPVVMPPEELAAVRKEFFAQVAYLFQVMRKVENRGFMFRLDYNEYLSTLAASEGSS